MSNQKNSFLKEYSFDVALGTNTTQEDVFTKCKIPQMIDKVVEGYHATIFAYGQTGAGKTYTMEGGINDREGEIYEEGKHIGIIPRSIVYLFEKIMQEKNKGKRKYNTYISYLQLYNERIYDLLNPSNFATTAGLKMRYKDGGFIVENQYTFESKSAKDAFELFRFGQQNRITASHKLNEASSRSHSIFCVTVESFDDLNPVSIFQ